MSAQVTIVNRALVGIGCLPIQSFLVPGPQGTNPERTFERILGDLISKYPWHFAHSYAPLQRRTAAPARGWTYAFALPPDRLAAPRAYYDSARSDRPFKRLELSEDAVLTDAERLWAFYARLPHPSFWPGYFTELVILCCQAEFALSIREDAVLRDRLRRDAYGDPQYQGQGGQFAVAAQLDAQSAPSPQIDGGRDPLTSSRMSGFSAQDARDGFEDW